MDGASSSKTALKSGADGESRRSTNSASPTVQRQRSNDEQSGNLGLTGARALHSVAAAVVRRHTKKRSWQLPISCVYEGQLLFMALVSFGVLLEMHREL